jgi:hypothetical protein
MLCIHQLFAASASCLLCPATGALAASKHVHSKHVHSKHVHKPACARAQPLTPAPGRTHLYKRDVNVRPHASSLTSTAGGASRKNHSQPRESSPSGAQPRAYAGSGGGGPTAAPRRVACTVCCSSFCCCGCNCFLDFAPTASSTVALMSSWSMRKSQRALSSITLGRGVGECERSAGFRRAGFLLQPCAPPSHIEGTCSARGMHTAAAERQVLPAGAASRRGAIGGQWPPGGR